MPWCDTCDQYLAPPAVSSDGTCPTCGRKVDRGMLRTDKRMEKQARRHQAEHPDESPDEPLPPVPWHFKALVGAVVIYLGYRFMQLLQWVF
jgi:PHP family Zn ribbon phosphoesterase